MTNFLVRLFVKNSDDIKNAYVRERYGRLAGAVGIVSNLLLFAFKLAVGFLSGSIAIMADAVNNLSDCTSSVVTLAAFKLASMPPDDKHPYGHARYEYVSGLVVSFFIMLIGFQFLISSVGKILSPEPVSFNAAVAVILSISILVKLWQGLFNRRIGSRIDSEALRATAADSINDVVATAVVLLGAVIAHYTGLHLDGWLGLLVAAFVLVSGVRLVVDTLNPLLGMAPDLELVAQIEEKILRYPSVIGTHDLIVHNYGPGRVFASVHVEVPASQDIMLSHDIIDSIERDLMRELNLELVVHLDPLATDDMRLEGFRVRVKDIVAHVDSRLSMHDFRMVERKTHTKLIFDVVVPPRFRLADRELRAEIEQHVQREISPDVSCVITIDHKYTTARDAEDQL